jgi:outer membrane immunogenic protein
MRRILLSAVASVGLSATAFAADLPARPYAKVPVPTIAVYDWSGCHIGASIGGMWGNAAIEHTFAAPTHIGTDPGGFVGGGRIGCDYQNPSNWLIGVQGEFNWTSAHNRQTIFPPFPYVSETLDASVDWYASATARLGYVSGPWLFYGKGGAAWARDRFHDVGQLASSNFDFSANVTRSGWTAGAGLEYAFAPNWSAVLEYGYYNFGTSSVTLSGVTGGPGGLAPGSSNGTLNQNFSAVTAGVSYRFSTGH